MVLHLLNSEVGELFKKHEYLMESPVLNAEEKKKFMKNQMNTGKIQVIMQLFVHLLIMRVQAYFSKNDWKSQIYSV